MSFGGHKDDASRRDLTINSLYLLLNNDDGPNTAITDFHGGVHDVETGNVRFVGKPEERLEEDLTRALRYARFAASVGGGKTSADIDKVIKNIAPQIREKVSAEGIQKEFVKGLEDDDVDPAKYIKVYKQLGLLDVVFPGLKVRLDSPDDYPKDRDRTVVVASLLRGNDPDLIRQSLVDGKWPKQDIARVEFLHNILSLNPAMSPDDLDKHLAGYHRTGIMGKSLDGWWGHNQKGNPPLLRAFLDLAKGPRVRTFVNDDETGESKLDPDFGDLFDKISNKPIPGMGQEIGKRKRDKEHGNFMSLYQSYQPRARQSTGE